MASSDKGDAPIDDVLGVTGFGRLAEASAAPPADPDAEPLDLRLEHPGGPRTEQLGTRDIDDVHGMAGRGGPGTPRVKSDLDELVAKAGASGTRMSATGRGGVDSPDGDEGGPRGIRIEAAPGPAKSAQAAPSVVEGYGHPSPRRDDAFPVSPGTPRDPRGPATTEAYGYPLGGPPAARPGRKVGPETDRPRPPGDPTVRGGGRLSASPGMSGPLAAVATGLEDLMAPATPAGWRDRKTEAPPPEPEGPAPGTVVVKPPVLEIVGEPGPGQAGLEVVREQVRRHIDFQHQRFEMLKVRRTVYRTSGGTEAAALPHYIAGRVPVANGMLAQLAAARFSDHDSLDTWARLLGRFDIPAPAQRLREAFSLLSAAVAPVFLALEEEVLSRPDAVDASDLAARAPGPTRLVEGRIRAVRRGSSLWFVWRDLEDLSPVLREGTRAPAEGLRAFALFADVRGLSRMGRWAGIRRKLHAALPTDPERAAYGLFLAHRVRAAWSLTPDAEALGRAAASFHRWATGLRATFDAPRSTLERAVLGAVAEWSALDPLDAAGRPASPLEKAGEGRQMPVFQLDPRDADPVGLLAWHSLVETCHGLGVRPWVYLSDLVDAVAAGGLDDPARWTPAAWHARPHG